eukprot:6190541-Pleurochrysis_carterae.AAC.5
MNHLTSAPEGAGCSLGSSVNQDENACAYEELTNVNTKQLQRPPKAGDTSESSLKSVQADAQRTVLKHPVSRKAEVHSDACRKNERASLSWPTRMQAKNAALCAPAQQLRRTFAPTAYGLRLCLHSLASM